jgi:hypothetical protein
MVVQGDGYASVVVNDPLPDFRSAATLPLPRSPLVLDLCADCFVRTIAFLGLPGDTLSPKPAPSADLAGALTAGEMSVILNEEDEEESS